MLLAEPMFLFNFLSACSKIFGKFDLAAAAAAAAAAASTEAHFCLDRADLLAFPASERNIFRLECMPLICLSLKPTRRHFAQPFI
jgi:hypothetical protein